MKKLAWLGFVLGLAALPLSVSAEQQPTPQVQTQKADGIWIDVRSAEEFAEGHLDAALNIPHTEIVEKVSQLKLAKDAQINLYCRSGRRADVALAELKKLGYSNVTNYGGYEDLKKQGLK